MAGTSHCTLTTPEEKIFEGDVRSIVIPASDGEMGILPGHAPMVASLGFGELRIKDGADATRRFFLEGGFVQVLGRQVTVLAASATPVEELDRATEESRLMELRDARPAKNATLEERDEYARHLAVVRSRWKLSARAG